MINIADILTPSNIHLALAAQDKQGAIEETLAKLNGDPHVRDFTAFAKVLQDKESPSLLQHGVGICIAHARTEAVGSLVMAAGRSEKGIVTSEIAAPVRLIFVAGIPQAMSSEYLRVVGAIARICSNKEELQKLLSLRSADKFVQLLTRGEIRL